MPAPGTPGVDWAEYDGPRGDYVLEREGDGTWHIRHAEGGPATPLPGIERVVFDDGAVALDLGASELAEQAARLVFSLRGQPGLADPALMGEVIAYLDALGPSQAARIAEDLGLLAALAGGTEPADLITLLHQNIMGRAPTPEELQALLDFQQAGGHSAGELLVIAAGLSETAQAMQLAQLRMEGLPFDVYQGALWGSPADQRFRAQPGDDQFYAGWGLDTVVYGGDAADYNLRREADGYWSVRGEVPDGSHDQFWQVERLEFADHAVALDLEGNAGAAVRLLAAAKGADALNDRALVGELIAYVDAHGAQGLARDAQANGILDALAGGDSLEALIALLYQNVAGQAPSDADMQWALELAQAQQWERADVLLYAAELPQTAALIGLPTLAVQGIAYEPWG